MLVANIISKFCCFIWFDVKISEDSSNEWAQVGMISLIKTSASSSARFDVKTSSARIPQTVYSNQRPGRMSERLVVSQIIWSEGSLFRTDYFQFEFADYLRNVEVFHFKIIARLLNTPVLHLNNWWSPFSSSFVKHFCLWFDKLMSNSI